MKYIVFIVCCAFLACGQAEAATKSHCPNKVLDTGTIEGIYRGVECGDSCFATIELLSGEKFSLFADEQAAEKALGSGKGQRVSVQYKVEQFWRNESDSGDDKHGFCQRAEVFVSGKVLAADPAPSTASSPNAASGQLDAEIASLHAARKQLEEAAQALKAERQQMEESAQALKARNADALAKRNALLNSAPAPQQGAAVVPAKTAQQAPAPAPQRGQTVAQSSRPDSKATASNTVGVQTVVQSKQQQAAQPTENAAKDFKELERLAEQGNAEAQNNLGRWFLEAGDHERSTVEKVNLPPGLASRIVPKNYLKAAAWFKKAADQGHPAAQRNLGRMYENGWGVAKLKSRAVEWYQKAAAQGDEVAKMALENLK